MINIYFYTICLKINQKASDKYSYIPKTQIIHKKTITSKGKNFKKNTINTSMNRVFHKYGIFPLLAH